MTLPSSFPISASQINVELGRNSGDPFDIQGVNERALAGVASGTISMSDFLGKSSKGLSITYSNFAGGNSWTSVPLGAVQTNRRNYIALIHGTVATDPGQNPTLTVGGVAATKLGLGYTTGSASPPPATGLAWFQSNPQVATANISATWASMTNFGIVVVSAVAYTTYVDQEADGGAQGGSDGQVSLNTQAGGAMLSASTYGSVQTPTWSELSRQLTWTLGWAGSTNNTGGLAWLEGMVGGASPSYHVTPHTTGNGNYMSLWTSIGP